MRHAEFARGTGGTATQEIFRPDSVRSQVHGVENRNNWINVRDPFPLWV